MPKSLRMRTYTKKGEGGTAANVSCAKRLPTGCPFRDQTVRSFAAQRSQGRGTPAAKSRSLALSTPSRATAARVGDPGFGAHDDSPRQRRCRLKARAQGKPFENSGRARRNEVGERNTCGQKQIPRAKIRPSG